MKKMNINDLTLEEKVGQMLMFAFHGCDYSDQNIWLGQKIALILRLIIIQKQQEFWVALVV